MASSDSENDDLAPNSGTASEGANDDVASRFTIDSETIGVQTFQCRRNIVNCTPLTTSCRGRFRCYNPFQSQRERSF